MCIIYVICLCILINHICAYCTHIYIYIYTFIYIYIYMYIYIYIHDFVYGKCSSCASGRICRFTRRTIVVGTRRICLSAQETYFLVHE
jgi:hypothetical protein